MTALVLLWVSFVLCDISSELGKIRREIQKQNNPK